MNCYTCKGDKGGTCLFTGNLDKHDKLIEAIGTIDELNAFLGAAAAFSPNQDVKNIVCEIQNDLFSVGAELSSSENEKGKVVITGRHVMRLEALIDKLDEKLPTQTAFVMPSGTSSAMMLNIARTVARRAERALVRLDHSNRISAELLKYANRLSSLLHVLCRFENNKNSVKEKSPVYYYSK